ncbi:MAG: glutamate-5-semialdehyde dehydrogenase [Candidatus Brocadiia bacterium]|nr:glutamate-5-semialdehyde dehydrogenase [Candidatus Brocadiia bacterium]
MDVKRYVQGVARAARGAAFSIAAATAAQKNAVLEQMARNLHDSRDELKEKNRIDLEAGREAGLSSAMLDRLELTDTGIDEMAEELRMIAGLTDPVGHIIDGWVLPNGLKVQKVRVPLGVICIIYESRPNVTADAAALCVKSGNAVILRGGKEALQSNLAIYRQLAAACEAEGLDRDVVQLVETTDRAAVTELLHADDCIDVVIPRGGKGLIRAVVETSTIPVIKHYEGICHTFVDARCDLEMALRVCENAKCQRPGVCNAMETMLVHEDVAKAFLGRMVPILRERGVELRGCERTREIAREIAPDMAPAAEEDWRTEYLDMILSVRVVADVNEAIEHINTYGSHHSDAILTDDHSNAQLFLDRVDSAAVYVNASTRFTDGGQFGLGSEIGISTNKLHVRGPMALEELTTYKWTIIGSGQLRS